MNSHEINMIEEQVNECLVSNINNYYLIYGLDKEESELTQGHLYGSYFSRMNHTFETQSGLGDAIKCVDLETAKIMLDKANEFYGEIKRFHIVEMSKLCFGIFAHKDVCSIRELKEFKHALQPHKMVRFYHVNASNIEIEHKELI